MLLGLLYCGLLSKLSAEARFTETLSVGLVAGHNASIVAEKRAVIVLGCWWALLELPVLLACCCPDQAPVSFPCCCCITGKECCL